MFFAFHVFFNFLFCYNFDSVFFFLEMRFFRSFVLFALFDFLHVSILSCFEFFFVARSTQKGEER